MGDLKVSVEESLLGAQWEAMIALRQMNIMNGLRIFIRPDKGSVKDNVF